VRSKNENESGIWVEQGSGVARPSRWRRRQRACRQDKTTRQLWAHAHDSESILPSSTIHSADRLQRTRSDTPCRKLIPKGDARADERTSHRPSTAPKARSPRWAWTCRRQGPTPWSWRSADCCSSARSRRGVRQAAVVLLGATAGSPMAAVAARQQRARHQQPHQQQCEDDQQQQPSTAA
jgi:hypothetical protein